MKMKRELKFRAFDKEAKEMFDVGMIDFERKEVRYTDNPTGYYADAVFESIELMQYTGLKDKNGVEIYEGDICKHLTFEGGTEIGEICFWEGSFVFKVKYLSSEDSLVNYNSYKTLEVIGNIYETK